MLKDYSPGSGSASIQMSQPKESGSILKRYVWIASGRLHRGRFDGFVVVQGIISNDPQNCGSFAVHGINFVGHFKAGKPHGVCWRELLGGGWIYGEVNKDGDFTGGLPGPSLLPY